MAATVASITTTWNIDPSHAHAQFKVKHMMISNVKGEFTGVSGKLELNSEDIGKSSVEAVIDTRTLNTREPQRDAHLKSADFFDVEKFPTIAFKSTLVSKLNDSELAVEGDLTMHGVTRQVVLGVEGPTPQIKDPWGNTRIGVSAVTKVDRKDFGLMWNAALETGGVLVGEEVDLTLEIEFIKAS
jgi:polyisoprenoid-binding protein YceI